MAPPPEYDKEPKAPDKSATNISTEDSKLLHNLVNDQHTNSDHKPTNTVAAVEVENNKHVETLDDGQLRALLDEAITYKCPKDREGKSSLFKELLEEVEQDEQACEAAARTLSGCRGARRGGRGRRALPHSNSLQDLVAALAAEPAPRRHHVRHHPPAPAPSNVSARAIHGGSLPSGVDTSSLLSEEPARGAGYLATVRCVNPPPLAERRVSASDANAPAEMELLNRRSKPMFPMTYTARATLEIGSGSVCSGRAVTTTTASNQVRTPPRLAAPQSRAPAPPALPAPVLIDTRRHRNQIKLMNALRPMKQIDEGGGINDELEIEGTSTVDLKNEKSKPRGPIVPNQHSGNKEDIRSFQPSSQKTRYSTNKKNEKGNDTDSSLLWAKNVDSWYNSLSTYTDPLYYANFIKIEEKNTHSKVKDIQTDRKNIESTNMAKHSILSFATNADNFSCDSSLKHDSNIIHNLPENRIKNKTAKDPLISRNIYHHDEVLHKVDTNFEHDYKKCNNRFRTEYKKQVGNELVVPSLSDINPRNVRRMTIGQPLPHIQYHSHVIDTQHKEKRPQKTKKENTAKILCSDEIDDAANPILNEYIINSKLNNGIKDINEAKSSQVFNSSTKCYDSCDEVEDITWLTNSFVNKSQGHEIELDDVSSSNSQKKYNEDSFLQYVSNQQRLLESLGNYGDNNVMITTREYETEVYKHLNKPVNVTGNLICDAEILIVDECPEAVCVEENKIVARTNKPEDDITTKSNSIMLAQLTNNAYIFLPLPNPLVSSLNSNANTPVQLFEIQNNNNFEPSVFESNSKPNNNKKKRQKMPPEHPVSIDVKRSAQNKNALKVLLFESLLKHNVSESLSHNSEASAITKEVDSAISFSCITTPEVVSSCNTTSSTAQSAVAVDPKPRSVISSSFNGLPLSRPNYGATGNSASDDYKKSLDENGNSVQGFSSPLSGSSQHKKPRRKKSSKNETVIDCQQIDGYQGDKDVNELLRFIESNADNGCRPKLGRVKHKDDSEDKTGKKRSTERRKDKENKIKRATSMEELSRTKIEDLTDVAESPLRSDKKERRSDAPAKAERRSWGDDALYSDAPPDTTAAAVELTDFQTVTKKRKPRRRADEPAPRRARPPSPRPRRESAPPSDRSNDSNDDMDSVHSLPAAPPPAPPAAPPPAPHASYAEIARTRHNIPDLIESCNFYAEGEGGTARDPAAAPHDADGYPALEVRAAAARRRDLKPAPAALRRKAAPPADAPRAPDCPAPDVVADRRPPVVLLDSAVRPRDMDGVTFGFDINEQLLGGGARRPRCDLLRDAPEAGVRAGCALRFVPPDAAPDAGCALRYVPPDVTPDAAQLLQLVDYVGAAWEDVVRCGGGKVRYFSE